jgi:Cu-Zn family superoxide dismutase
MSRRFTLGIVGVLGLVGISCAADHQHEQGAAAVKAVAQIAPTKGNNVKGTVTFTQEGDRVRIVAHVSGLKANSEHGFHIHEGSECGEDGMAAGGHYNPDNQKPQGSINKNRPPQPAS